MQANPTIPSGIPPLNNFEDVRQVLSHLLTSFNAALASLPQTNFNGQRLTRVGLPTSQDDAATKGYVDGVSAGPIGGTATGAAAFAGIGVNIVPKSNGRTFIPSNITDTGINLLINDNQDVAGIIRTTTLVNNNLPGTGLELALFSSTGFVQSLIRPVNTFIPLVVQGKPVMVNPQGSNIQLIGTCAVNGAAGAFAMDITGDCNVSGVYRKGGTAGISASLNLGTSVTVNTATAVTSVSGSGVSSTTGTFVTSVTLNVVAATFSGGIRTA